MELDATIIGFSFAWEAYTAYYVPLVHQGKTLIDEGGVKSLLRTYLEEGRLKVVGQNIRFDYKVLRRWNITSNTSTGLMIAAWLLDAASTLNMDFGAPLSGR